MRTRRVPGAKTLAEIKATLTSVERALVKKARTELRQEELSRCDLRKAREITREKKRL